MTSRDKRELEERRKIDVTQHANDPGGYLNFCKENFFRDFKQNFRHPPNPQTQTHAQNFLLHYHGFCAVFCSFAESSFGSSKE